VRLRTRERCCSLRSFPNAPGLHPRCPSRKHPLYPNPQLAHSKSRPALPYGTVARPRSPLLRSSSTSPGFWSQLGSIPTISYTFETVNGPQAVGRGQEDLAAADWARAGVATACAAAAGLAPGAARVRRRDLRRHRVARCKGRRAAADRCAPVSRMDIGRPRSSSRRYAAMALPDLTCSRRDRRSRARPALVEQIPAPILQATSSWLTSPPTASKAAHCDRRCRRAADLPATLQSGPAPDRARLRQAQGRVPPRPGAPRGRSGQIAGRLQTHPGALSRRAWRGSVLSRNTLPFTAGPCRGCPPVADCDSLRRRSLACA
jgi:hypothetical protein